MSTTPRDRLRETLGSGRGDELIHEPRHASLRALASRIYALRMGHIEPDEPHGTFFDVVTGENLLDGRRGAE